MITQEILKLDSHSVMNESLNDDNFLIYAARHYDHSFCCSTDEFLEDLKRIKYIKKLLTRYIDTGELKERLILNHIIVLNNMFGAEHVCRILYLKLGDYFNFIMPFLILLNILPDKLYNIRNQLVIDLDMITMDTNIVEKLRKI
jgi:hypothetical protein